MDVFNDINGPQYNSNPEKFILWVDRQKRPTIGATVIRGETRQEIGNDVFIKMLKTLTDTCQKLVPGHLCGAYIVYAVGSWKRSRNFHVKVHLPTAVFLSLTGKFCQGIPNPLAQFEDELKRREQKDRREVVLREVLTKLLAEERISWKTEGNFCVATVKQLDYPLVCLYQSVGGKLTTSISIDQLPEALDLLEKFLKEEWGSRGFHVGMVLSSESSPAHFQVAANVDEGVFAKYTKKDVKKVQASWNWHESVRRYH